MRNPIRLLVLACVSFIALAVAGTALAAYTPRLIINQQTYRPGAAGGVEIFASIPQAHDATAKLMIIAPPGYTATLTQAPGARIGSVVARVKANALGGAILPLTGNVTVGNPADPTLQAAATRCTTTPTHQAIWILNLTLQGQSLQVPVYVDVIGGVIRLQVCLGSPHVPEAQGGARFGAQLVVADFTVLGVFRNATARGTYGWSGLFTPYVAGTATANAPGTVESRAIVPLPYGLTISRAKGTGVRLTGTLTAAGRPLQSARPEIYAAPNGRVQGRLVTRGSATNRAGRYNARRRAVTRATWFHAEFGPADLGAAGCAGQSLAPAGCVTSTLAPVISNTIKVSPPRKKRR